MIFQNYHNHKYYTNIIVPDSHTSIEAYAKRAKELGHKILSSCEHGWQGRYYETYQVAKKYDLKFLFGTEAYWVKDRTEKDATNCHICIFAKNEQGRREINDVLSEANISGFYRVPRLDFELIFSLTPENVFITSACVAFWKYDDAENMVINLHKKFKDNFMLEVQNHNTEKQKLLKKEANSNEVPSKLY
jgi:DNA polymerase III alpha subunit